MGRARSKRRGVAVRRVAAATTLQRVHRGHEGRRAMLRRRVRRCQDAAAGVIQKGVRRYVTWLLCKRMTWLLYNNTMVSLSTYLSTSLGILPR